MEKGVPIRSVSRSISVLQAINRHGSLSMTGIARHGALPYPTACRIVQTLLHEGLIEQEPTRKYYRPTALVQSLAHGFHADHELSSVARPHMSDLTRQIGWPLFIAVRVGTQMVVRESTHAETSLTFGLCHPGFTVPLLGSATGSAWLANMPREEGENLIRWAEDVHGLTRPIDRGDLAALLSRVRAEGFAARPCLNDSPNRSSSIAAPILLDGQVVAVLTVTYFYAAMTQAAALERYLSPLIESAKRIGRALDACRQEQYAA